MTTTPAQQFRVERCGNMLVYIPLTPPPAPDVHSLRRELSVASA